VASVSEIEEKVIQIVSDQLSVDKGEIFAGNIVRQ